MADAAVSRPAARSSTGAYDRAGFVTAAVWLRARKETHERLMLLAYASIITAAVGRIAGVVSVGPLLALGLSLTFVLAGVIYDFAARGRVHPADVWGGTLLALSLPLRLAISGTAAWRVLAESLVR
jgi:hypothetical protein